MAAPRDSRAPRRTGAVAGSGTCLWALLAWAWAPACRGPATADVLAANQDTPQATVAAFQLYLRADLYEQEYDCFSSGFRARNGLSLWGYSEFRDRLAREQPWYKLIAKAEIVGQESLGERAHAVVLEVAGRTLRVSLVREDFFRIWWGTDLEDGRTPLEKVVRIEPRRDGQAELVARLPLEGSERTLAELSSATVERLWRIDAVEQVEPR